jgi:hypothetical protein
VGEVNLEVSDEIAVGSEEVDLSSSVRRGVTLSHELETGDEVVADLGSVVDVADVDRGDRTVVEAEIGFESTFSNRHSSSSPSSSYPDLTRGWKLLVVVEKIVSVREVNRGSRVPDEELTLTGRARSKCEFVGDSSDEGSRRRFLGEEPDATTFRGREGEAIEERTRFGSRSDAIDQLGGESFGAGSDIGKVETVYHTRNAYRGRGEVGSGVASE